MILKYKLPSGYKLKTVPTDEFAHLWKKPGKRLFNDRSLFYSAIDIHTKKELAQFKKLRVEFKSENHHRINLALFHKSKFVGWAWGFQETPTVFYMCNSAILEQHRRKGLYTCLMREMMKQVLAKGYAKLYSRHVMTNNDIIIAKLKQGFKITNFELSEAFGVMIHLTYFPQEIKNEILDFRTGLIRPNKKMKNIFKL